MKQTRMITEGAVLAAIFGVLLLISLYVPILGGIAAILLPTPFIIFVTRNGFKKGLLFFVVALFITWIAGTVVSIPATVLFGIAGLVMGHLYKGQKSAFSILIGGSLAFIAGITILYIGTIIFMGINIGDEVQKMTTQSLEMSRGLLGSLGQSPDEEQMETFANAAKMLQFLIPAAIVLISVAFAIMTQTVSTLILRRLKFKAEKWPAFRDWQFPRSLIWYYLIATIFMMVGMEEGSTLYIAVINVYVVLEFVMTVQGFSFIFYYFHKKGKPKVIPVLLVIFSFLLPFIGLYIVRILGIIDLGFDLRKRIKE